MRVDEVDETKFYLEETCLCWIKIQSLRFQRNTNPDDLNKAGIFARAVLEHEEQLYAAKERQAIAD